VPDIESAPDPLNEAAGQMVRVATDVAGVAATIARSHTRRAAGTAGGPLNPVLATVEDVRRHAFPTPATVPLTPMHGSPGGAAHPLLQHAAAAGPPPPAAAPPGEAPTP
jgi:hypothetical protein